MRGELFNSKGFGIVGILIVVVVLAVVTSGGAYVYHRDHKAKTSTTDSSSNRNSKHTGTTTTPSLYAGWKTYTIASTELSFKYPVGWTISDIPQSNGTDNFAIRAPASELADLKVSPIGEAITSYEVSVSTEGGGSSVRNMPVGAQSQSNIIESGSLKGKYLLVNGDSADGVSELFVLNNNYQPGQKIAETGILTVGGKQYMIVATLMAGQDIGDADSSSFVNSQLYKDTLNILQSMDTN